MSRREQTTEEEKINALTHAIGIVFAVVTIPILIFYALDKSTAPTVFGVAVFCFAMLMVYSASTIYHTVQLGTPLKRKLRIWDHISIFVMIGGSYTPLVIKFTSPSTATVFLATMWGIIVLGSLLKVYFTGRYVILEVAIYILLGWMAVFIIKPLMANMPSQIITFILVSGLFYSIGVVFYLWKKLSYHHAVWHVFVLAGTVTHFFAVYNSIPLSIKT
jgi:hemolysin III